MGHKTRIVVIVFFCIAMVAGAVVLLGNSIIMVFAPKLILSSAIQQAMAQLEQRWVESPFAVLAKAYDSSGKSTSVVNLSIEDDFLGEMEFDFDLQTNFLENQILAIGTIQGEKLSFDASIFLNQKYAAVSSQALLQGGYYGITYSTFSQDLSQIPFSSFLLPKETIAGWKKKVDDIGQWMNQSRTFPEIPEISEDNLQLLTIGILAMECDISREERIVDSQSVQCYRYCYSANGSQVQPLIKILLGTQSEKEGNIRADFYLENKKLVGIEIVVSSDGDHASYTLNLSEDILHGPISFGFLRRNGNLSSTFSAAVYPGQKEERGAETISINDIGFSYKWDRVSGALQLSIPGKQDITLFISSMDDVVSISIEDLSPVWNSLEGKRSRCDLAIKKGSSIVAPAYKNLDEWSFQDLLTLLTGVGTVLDIF